MKKSHLLLFGIFILISLYCMPINAYTIPKDASVYNGHCYKVYDVSKTWLDSKAYCEALGGHLITVTSREEQIFVNHLKKNKKVYWLGITDQETEGIWKTIDGIPLSYTNWSDGEPTKTNKENGKEEDYASLNYNSEASSYGAWYDECNEGGDIDNYRLSDHGIICEWDYVNPENTINKEIVTIRDNDLSISEYEFLQAKICKTTKTSLTLTWKKIKNADGYIIYGNKCGTKNQYNYLRTIANPSTTKYKMSHLKKGTYYKYFIVAYKNISNDQAIITVSKTIHATTNGGKYGNAKKVKITKLANSVKSTSKITLSVGKTAIIKGTSVKKDKKIKRHRGLAYESTNPAVASIISSGTILARKKGNCKIYVYAQNGMSKTITVHVK